MNNRKRKIVLYGGRGYRYVVQGFLCIENSGYKNILKAEYDGVL